MLESLMKLEALYKDFDTAEKQLESELGVSICKAGCGKCCEVAVPPAFRLEALFVVSYATGAGMLQKVVDLSEGWLLERHTEAPTYEGRKLGYLDFKIRDEFYALLKSQCPFLTSAKQCLIHKGRPLVCHAYGVTHIPGPTADFCPRPLGKHETESVKGFMDLIGVKEAFLSTVNLQKEMNICALLPSLIFRIARPKKWTAYIADNRIASAKLVALPNKYVGMITQEQMNQEYSRM